MLFSANTKHIPLLNSAKLLLLTAQGSLIWLRIPVCLHKITFHHSSRKVGPKDKVIQFGFAFVMSFPWQAPGFVYSIWLIFYSFYKCIQLYFH